MKILMIGSDRLLFDAHSDVRKRVASYSVLGEEVHVIVNAQKKLGFTAEQIAENVWIHPTNSFSRWTYARGVLRIAKKLLSNNTSDWVISSQDPFENGRVARSLSRRIHVPYQVQVHTDMCSLVFLEKTPLNRIRMHIAKKVLRDASGIRVVSERIKNGLLQKYPSLSEHSIDVLPIYVDVLLYAKPVATAVRAEVQGVDPLFLVLSRLEPEKRIRDVLTALVDVVAAHTTAGLLIVGEGSEKEALMQLVREYKLTEHVRFAPWVHDTVPFYKAADVFIMSSAFEGFGRTIVEAGAAGCSVISTRVGIAESFEDGRELLLCDVGDTKCLAAHMKQLARDKGFRASLSVHMKSRLAELFPPTYDAYLEEYGRLLTKAKQA